MIPHSRQLFIRLFFSLIFIAVFTAEAAGDSLKAEVRYVIDGDTLILSSSEHVRLLGLDAPEKGEAYADKARWRLIELVERETVMLDTCPQRDIYGRQLAVVRSAGTNVNIVLLKEGLAVPMLIPPCGRMVAEEVLKAARIALLERKGLYANAGYEVVHHDKAGEYLGKRAVIRGKILNLHKGEKAWHLNFGQDWRTDFTAVLFEKGRLRFHALGIDPEQLVGSEVLVIGKVKRYNGPEIIVRNPEQIIPVH